MKTLLLGSVAFGATLGSIVGYDKLSKHFNYKNNIFLNSKEADKFMSKCHPFPDTYKKTVCIVGAGVVGVASAYKLL